MGRSRGGVLSDHFIMSHCMKYQAVPMAAVTKVLGKTADGRPPPRPATFATMAKNLTTMNPQLRMDKIVDTYRDELKTVARELKVTRAELAAATRPTTPSTGSNTSVTNAEETPPGSLDGYEEYQATPGLNERASDFLEELSTGRASLGRSSTESYRQRRASLMAETAELDERLRRLSPHMNLPSDVNNVGFPPQHLNLRPRDIDYMRQRARAEIARHDALQAELDAEDSD